MGSDVLGLHLVLEEGRLRLYDLRQKQFLLAPSEAAEAQRQTEAALRRAEAENARLRAELERMQKQLKVTTRAKRSQPRRKS